MGSVLYECVFTMYKNRRSAISNNMSDFTSGFWIDRGYEFTKTDDAKYWIPPSQIYFIAKIHTKEQNEI